ncbi:hypothetical protein QN277_012618 [Acacia crassicarpa]|uniref:Uncharacterized protein n=1 Tax=Acacia crassicarpa TaxID=499986 RepID=A0AAE1N128_9FABA|nr:hypothetical protein QN277_012618 [Acacia crassicarpa]
MNIEKMDTNSELKATKSFTGNFLLKSAACFREVSIDRNMINAVIAKLGNPAFPSKVGVLVLSSLPPGTVLNVAKATPATTEQDSDVRPSHSSLFSRRASRSRRNTCSGASPCWFVRKTKRDGTNNFTYCNIFKSHRQIRCM